ncbi:R3H and coiled-coil domain-containing protein 1-like [Pollicipes pollicipes]|uniref:R3H and coiled-coil domain-containing protein 1-like n=1 Tax=Pollicipes pollicipes TaxID=41117 RepID=UPI0018855981|nr:R3H and coiled-coil domain-containing protein 1-like [Pollicipes pollicipes]
MQHLGLRTDTPRLPRTDSRGQLVNTTDDEKATLGGRGRGRGRRDRPPGAGPDCHPQSDENKAQLRRPGAEHAFRSGKRDPAPPRAGDDILRSAGGGDRSPRVGGEGDVGGVGGVDYPLRKVASGEGASRPSVGLALAPTSPVLSGTVAQGVPPRPADVAPAVPPPESGEPRCDPSPSPREREPVPTVTSRPRPPPDRDESGVESAPAGGSASAAATPDGGVTAQETPPRAEEAHSRPPSSDEGATLAANRPRAAETADGGPAEQEGGGERDSPEGKARRHSSASSGRGLFSLSLEEPFSWADEVEEWERRFNDDGDANEPAAKEPPAPAQKSPSRRSRRRSQHAPPQPAEEVNDPSMPAHVIELYNFPSSFSLQDFNVVFQAFVERGFDVRRVDDTHALGIFANAACAAEALQLCHPMLLSRPLAQATPRSRQRAARPADVQPPYRLRPETSALHADRMVASALGMRVGPAGRQRRDYERRKLRDARDKKRQASKQKDDAWEGRF